MLTGPGQTIRLARRLRREMSLPEVLLWRVLRIRPDGLKFRRQHPAGSYVLDFFCLEARLAIEIDGEAHSRGDHPSKDAQRDNWLAGKGVRMLRIPARMVLSDLPSVVDHIVATAGQPLHQPTAGPPPRSGEDFCGNSS